MHSVDSEILRIDYNENDFSETDSRSSIVGGKRINKGRFEPHPTRKSNFNKTPEWLLNTERHYEY